MTAWNFRLVVLTISNTCLWIDYITDENDGLYFVFDKRDADGMFLKIDERKCLVSRGWRRIYFLRVAHCHRTIMNIPLVSFLSSFSHVLKFSSFDRREREIPLSLLKRAPEYSCHGEAGLDLGRTPRAFALFGLDLRFSNPQRSIRD